MGKLDVGIVPKTFFYKDWRYQENSKTRMQMEDDQAREDMRRRNMSYNLQYLDMASCLVASADGMHIESWLGLDIGRVMKRQNVRTLSLVVCTFTYLLIGAAVFDALESDTESRRSDMLKDIKNGLIRKYNISAEDYHMIEIVIIENKPHKAGPQWKFAGAFYFATVVIAVIGYGHSTPVTIGGKAFCMAYAMVGIPLGLVMFQSIGERLNKFASVVIRRAKCYLRCNTTEATEMNLMFATGLLSSVIITTGAAVFSRYEGWSYFDSFYYCFVTLTTIGFGDYVALQNDQALTSKPGYVALSLVFILFGLAVVAASINLLVLRFMTMNAEDIKREDNELQSSSHHVLTLDGEVMAVNGKILAGHGNNMRAVQDDDQASVCSCNCLGNTHCNPHELLLGNGGPCEERAAPPPRRRPSLALLLHQGKRASV